MEDKAMFIAMNRFKIVKGRESDFEIVWRTRDSRLSDVPGFLEFQLLRGPVSEAYTLFASHTLWMDKAAFEAWTKSEAFKQAHAGAGETRGMYIGHPEFEGFESVMQSLPAGA
jgi:heme-degrading monooxygenase HmoA